MATKKISELTNQTDITNTDLLIIETAGGASRKTTAAKLFSDTSAVSGRVSALEAAAKATVNKTASYVILDNDGYGRVTCDTTSGDVTITLPLMANNRARRIEIANVKGGTNKVIISPNATDANKVTNDALNVLWLPKVGDFIILQENVSSGFWDVITEKITGSLELNTYAGHGSTDNKIMRLTNLAYSVGNVFSENHSTGYSSNAKGLEITVNRSGRYSFGVLASGGSGNGGFMGISVDSNQLTTAVTTITQLHRKKVITLAGSYVGDLQYEAYLTKGQVIRLHGDGGVPALSGLVKVIVEYLG